MSSKRSGPPGSDWLRCSNLDEEPNFGGPELMDEEGNGGRGGELRGYAEHVPVYVGAYLSLSRLKKKEKS